MAQELTGNGNIAAFAGIECTINRVGDQYYDQLEFAGHYKRPEDIDRIASLGIKAIRYPVLWERHQPVKEAGIDWSFTTANLERIRHHDITVIAGLVHHGSGPAWVNFFDGSFEEGLAAYALEAAQKFPWINYYTPVNEPLTTARFCGLYGLWHPHGKSDEVFARILISECKATVMAMQAIRTINPDAKLVQTDDLGKTYSAPNLAYQADFENRRRWLAWDLLCGKVKPGLPSWDYLLWAGIDEVELYYFLEHPTPPNIIGLNYYLTSERYIDDSLEHYPAHTHGGNGIHQYADVEAIRVPPGDDERGAAHLIREAWERYNLPLAITEVQLHCSREEQLRWFRHIWDTAVMLRRDEGIDITGVTAWSALGASGWDRLLTAPPGNYEPGLFDVRSGTPRATALEKLLEGLAKNSGDQHPVLAGKGWWEKPGRILYKKHLGAIDESKPGSEQPLLILGRTGTLGKAFSRMCTERGIHHQLWGREDLDITSGTEMLTQKLAKLQPWAVINATGYVRVDDAESDAETCFAVNAKGAIDLAAACKLNRIKLLSFSSDLVFDGTKDGAYCELDSPNPLNVYGVSKAAGEVGISQQCPDALIVRTSAFFSPWDDYNFVTTALREIAAGRPFMAANDLIVSPTYIPDLAHQCLDLLIDDASGIWHLSNSTPVSWYEFAREAAGRAGLDTQLIIALHHNEMHMAAARPANVSLSSIHGGIMPSLASALDKYFAAIGQAVQYEDFVTATI